MLLMFDTVYYFFVFYIALIIQLY